jgi:hypothetical protein
VEMFFGLHPSPPKLWAGTPREGYPGPEKSGKSR